MIADTINYQNLIHRSESFIRPASMISFLTHIIIIGIAFYGLPNFGRKLPPDLTVISFELLKVVEETNLDLAVKINPEKNIEIKENEAKQDEKTFDDPKKQITPSRQSEELNSPSQKSDILISPSEKPIIPISPSEKPSIPISPIQKPKKITKQEQPIQKPKSNKQITNIQKPIMKPQIQKEKIKKNKTNPNALTSVLKTLEKVKETQKQKQIAKNEKNKKEVAVKKKRKVELESMKNLVANAISSKPKNLIKPIGISEIENSRKILVFNKKHLERNQIDKKSKLSQNNEVLVLENTTDGTACTVLSAKKIINNKSPLLIANSDQIVEKTNEIHAKLKDLGVRVKIDDRENISLGFKLNDSEVKGIPMRIVIGLKEITLFKNPCSKFFECKTTRETLKYHHELMPQRGNSDIIQDFLTFDARSVEAPFENKHFA